MATATSKNAATTIKGLAQERSDLFKVDPEHLVVVEDKAHPLYDERVTLALSEDFITDIMRNGILQNVIIRKNGELFEVVAGRQRVRAAIEANNRFKKAGSDQRINVPVVVRRDDDISAAGITISENEQREADTPLVKARKAQRLINLGEPEAQVASRFRMNTAQLRNLLTLLDADASVQKAVEAGTIHVTAASKLTKLSRDEQRQAMQDLREAGRSLSKGNVAAKVKAKVESKRTGETEKELITPPSRKVITEVCAAYVTSGQQVTHPPEDVNPQDLAHLLLTWVLTGKGAARIVGPMSTMERPQFLSQYLRDLEGNAKLAAKKGSQE